MNKYEVMKALQDLYENDQQCSGNCFDCEYGKQCDNLEPLLVSLFGDKL